jgi:uncharacterized protein YwqG
MDKRAADVIEQIGAEWEVPDAIVGATLGRALPSIRLEPQRPDGAALPVGGCGIGGAPDLPAGVKWPRLSTAWEVPPEEVYPPDKPLSFLMQINLAEVASFDHAKVLPSSGMLWVFFHWEEEWQEGEETSYVLYAPGPMRKLRRLEPPDDLPGSKCYRGLALVPSLEWTVPSPADTGLDEGLVNEHLGFWDELEQRVSQAQGFGPHYEPRHRLLGHPQLIQSPGLADGTRLLLQVDSDCHLRDKGCPETGMTWGDAGRIYFLIDEGELKAHQFVRASPSVEMC